MQYATFAFTAEDETKNVGYKGLNTSFKENAVSTFDIFKIITILIKYVAHNSIGFMWVFGHQNPVSKSSSWLGFRLFPSHPPLFS